MKKIKVLHLISSVGFFGAENVVLEICKELSKSGFDPVIGIFNNQINPHLELADKAQESCIPFEVFSCKRAFDLRTILHIRKFIRMNNISIVHSHGYKSNFFLYLATININVPRISTCHLWFSNNIKDKIYEIIDRFILMRFDRIVVVSNALRTSIFRRGVASRKIEVIYNGIDLIRFSNPPTNKAKEKSSILREIFKIKEGDKIVGTVGRLDVQKGQVYLIRALKEVLLQVPNLKCLIVGDGPQRNKLELLVKQLNLGEHVVFTGNRDDVRDLFVLMDLFILPSLDEGLPMVLLEAMAMDKAIITTRVGGIPELIQDNYSGMMVDSMNSHALSKAILFLLFNQGKKEYFSRNGKEVVSNKFSSSKMASNYMKLYNNLL